MVVVDGRCTFNVLESLSLVHCSIGGSWNHCELGSRTLSLQLITSCKLIRKEGSKFYKHYWQQSLSTILTFMYIKRNLQNIPVYVIFPLSCFFFAFWFMSFLFRFAITFDLCLWGLWKQLCCNGVVQSFKKNLLWAIFYSLSNSNATNSSTPCAIPMLIVYELHNSNAQN